MIINTSHHIDLSYNSFLTELRTLLKQSEISPSRRLIRGEVNPNEGWYKSSPQECLPQIGRVIIYMEEHLTEQLSLEKLAEEAQLSKYQLIRLFRKERDTTPWKFLVGKRIEKVKELLENGVPPSQAAVEAGFYDQSHLNKKFREETGRTPKEYQEEYFKNRN